MSDNNGKNPMPNDDMGKDRLLAAFQNLGLYSNYNYSERSLYSNYNYNERRGESSNRNINSNNNNPNHNVYNVGHISTASFNNLPVTPPWVTQVGASPSRNSGQPSPSPLGFVSANNHKMQLDLLEMMTREERYPEFQEFLKESDTYTTGMRESALSTVSSILATNPVMFLELATNKTGSRALQTLFRRSLSFANLLFHGVYKNFYSLMTTKNGYKLIITTIRAVDKTHKEMLYKLTYCCAMDIANLETGCIALNEVIPEIKGSTRDLILELVAQNAIWLSFDPYGTHVVQNLVATHNPRATCLIAERLCGSFYKLTKLRQGSFLVEKCLRSDYVRQKVLDEFREDDKEWVKMASDTFGNFVTQCALKVMKQNGMRPMLREFLEKLKPHFGEMKTGPGKNTLRLIQQEFQEWIHQLPGSAQLFY